MGSFLGVFGTIGGAAMSYLGANQTANATQNAAMAQLTQAQAQQQYSQQLGNQGIAATAPSAANLQSQQNMLNNQNQTMSMAYSAYQRDVQLANATNPAIISAGQNLSALLNGQSAPTLAPIQAQRQLQRNQLQQQLQQQYGPGYASSSAGIQALTQFDTQTSGLMANAQQTAISSLINPVAGSNPNLVGASNQIGQTLGGLGAQTIQSGLGMQQTQMGGINSAQQWNTANSTTAYQGAPYASSMMMGNYYQQMGNQILGQSLATPGSSGGGGGGGGGFSGFGSGGYMPAGAADPSMGGTYGASALSMPEMGSQFGGAASVASLL